MSRHVAKVATGFAVLFVLGSLWFIRAGNYVAAGTFLTFVAFSIYFREINTD